MAYTEFILSQEEGAATFNAGYSVETPSTGEAAYGTTGTVDAGTPTVITCVGAVNTSLVAVGDWLTWDYTGVTERRMIIDINGANITVHRAMTAGANKNILVGGHLAGFRNAIAAIGSNVTAANWPASTPPPRLNVKAHASTPPPQLKVNAHGGAAYNETVGVEVADFGTPNESLPFVIEAFNSTPGDLDWRTTTTRAVIDWGTTAVHAMSPVDPSHRWVTLVNLDLRQSTSGYGHLLNGNSYVHLRNCSLKRSGRNIPIAQRVLGVAERCLFWRDYDGPNELLRVGSYGSLIDCVVRGNGDGVSVGVRLEQASQILRTLVTGCGQAIRMSLQGCSVIDCTLISNVSGIHLAEIAAAQATCKGNLIANNSGYGISNGISGTPTVYLPNCGGNFFYGNTSGSYPATIIPMQANTTLATDPFEDYAGGDYRIKTTSAAYGVRRNLPSGLDTDASFLDAGAIQRLRSEGGGGVGILINGGLIRGVR